MAIDFTTDIGKVRLKIGDISEPVFISDVIVQITLDEYSSETEKSVQIWKAALASLEIMIAEAANQSSRLREREGGVEIEEYRNQRYTALKERYRDLLDSPPPEFDIGNGAIIIGGVSKKESERSQDPNDAEHSPIGIGWFDKDEY